jgi:hypothetical protein
VVTAAKTKIAARNTVAVKAITVTSNLLFS